MSSGHVSGTAVLAIVAMVVGALAIVAVVVLLGAMPADPQLFDPAWAE